MSRSPILKFSLDLKKAALHEIKFLELIDNTKLLQDPDVIKIAAYRYQKLCLGFVRLD